MKNLQKDKEKLRIFIGTHEICGIIYNLKIGFEKLGHSVTTANDKENKYYDFYYDIDLSKKKKILNDDCSVKIIRNSVFFSNIYNKLRYWINLFYNKYLINKIIFKNDLFIFIWEPIVNIEILQKINKKNKKSIFYFVGSEIRDFTTFSMEFDVSQWSFPNEYVNTSIEEKLKKLRFAEKYCNAIFSVPDQSGLFLRPYFHTTIPIIIDKISFNNNAREKPIVIHIPSHPWVKGTDIIENTMMKLKEDGFEFEFKSYRNISNNKVLEILTDSDVLIDEIVFHGPGVLSFEAMAAGCVVATRYYENSPSIFRPPVWSINANNIYEKLKILLTNKDLRIKLAEEGRNYVLKNNNPLVVCEKILNSIELDSYDYYPCFLKDFKFYFDENSLKIIKKWNNFVKDCNWYKKYIETDTQK